MDRHVKYLFWATLCCILCFVSASEEDLMDFDFSDLKEIDWNYERDNNKVLLPKSTTEENTIKFDDDDDLMDENQFHPFDWRERVLRTALSKALANKAVRQKFIEVMPILRVLSKQQRLALSALITAQINAKKGNELKLEQVRMMFGDDKSLILPIVYDIANLVRNSAKKYIKFDYNLADFGDFSKAKFSYGRRNLELSPDEVEAEENNEGIGILPAAAQIMDLDRLEDFMSSEVLDPMEINEEFEKLKVVNNNTSKDSGNENIHTELEKKNDMTNPLDINHQLQKDVPTLTLLKLNRSQEMEMLTDTVPISEQPFEKAATRTTQKTLIRRMPRSVEKPEEFVHKLTRSVPLAANEDDLGRANAGRSLKLNTTAFASPKEFTIHAVSTTTTTKAPIVVTPEPVPAENFENYQLIEDMAFASLNGSEIFFDDNDSQENDFLSDNKTASDDEILPSPEELVSGPRYRMSSNKLKPIRTKAVSAKRKRIQVRARPKQGGAGNGVPAPEKCERFTASMCIKTDDYPINQIMGSIRRHRNAMTALLAEYSDKPLNALDTTEDFNGYVFAKKRREDNDVPGGLCQSIVRYARPQKARSASGEWKYIVNTGQHTQTLRLEKCMSPQESCSYLSTDYHSYCAQVYNYHRLLSWDKTRGLHVDIFKVPTCCSCQVDGFKHQFHAAVSYKKKDFTPIYKGNAYRQHQQLDYEEEEEDYGDNIGFAIQHHHHKHDTSFDANELSNNRIKSKVPNPTVGSYLSPPGSEDYEPRYSHKAQRDTAYHGYSSSKSSKKHYSRRRPQKSYDDGSSDQEFAPSEQHAERELIPAVAALATAAIRPSQPAPEPFVPSQLHLHQQTTRHDLDGPPSLIPMPTKSNHLQEQQSYQQQPPQQKHYHQHQQMQLQQQPQPHYHHQQHLYRPTITPAQEMSSKTNQGYVYHTRLRQPTLEVAVAKRPIQRLRQSSSTTSRQLQQQRHHRNNRLFML